MKAGSSSGTWRELCVIETVEGDMELSFIHIWSQGRSIRFLVGLRLTQTQQQYMGPSVRLYPNHHVWIEFVDCRPTHRDLLAPLLGY